MPSHLSPFLPSDFYAEVELTISLISRWDSKPHSVGPGNWSHQIALIVDEKCFLDSGPLEIGEIPGAIFLRAPPYAYRVGQMTIDSADMFTEGDEAVGIALSLPSGGGLALWRHDPTHTVMGSLRFVVFPGRPVA